MSSQNVDFMNPHVKIQTYAMGFMGVSGAIDD